MGLWDGLYRVLMRRNSVYVTFVVAGAFVGERMVDNGVHKLWDYCNVGRVQDMLTLMTWVSDLVCLSVAKRRNLRIFQFWDKDCQNDLVPRCSILKFLRLF
ncbi:cytochrome b-c1 complex subunit 9-like isoform X1 [Phoenix dactylifera]|uniref:Complex III subunit 9 n=1 Tax=Phoenix dactylifera TaxID=42345 RepID=A0A8B8ZU90_PHODC|nr:cytochrome b-c1 complex subunit 9-like isoform X1 [Phoenix dactylifera]